MPGGTAERYIVLVQGRVKRKAEEYLQAFPDLDK